MVMSERTIAQLRTDAARQTYVRAAGFDDWLRHQCERSDAVGQFARVTVNDPDWPRHAKTRQTFERSLRRRNVGADTLNAFSDAWREFARSVNATR
jgi:hypothetical protein